MSPSALLPIAFAWLLLSATVSAQAPRANSNAPAATERSYNADPIDSATESPDIDDASQPGADESAAPSTSNPPAASTGAPRSKPAVAAAPRPVRSFEAAPRAARPDASIAPLDADSGPLAGLVSEKRTADDGRRAVRLDPVAFQEVLPGESTVEQLEAKWGAPTRDQTKLGTGKRIYDIAPFKQVEVALEQGKVASIVAHLAEPAAVEEVARQFVPDAAGGVEVLDDQGLALGIAFPERGVVFSYTPGAKQVAQLLFDPIDHESFLLRAERNQHRSPQESLADIEFVLQKHAKHGAALSLAAQIYFEAGRMTEAAAKIDAAIQAEPNNTAYLLTKAEILAESGDFAGGQEICLRVLKQPQIAGELKARADCLLGDFLANGPARDYKRAIEHHLAAIQSAQQVADAKAAAPRRAAKGVLVCARLGVANDIAWGYWQQKERVVPKWLMQAHEAAEDLIDREGADESLHLLVLRRALAASAGTQGKLDPVAWTKEAVKTARRLIDASDDPWRRGRLEWELGLALYDALQADQARGYHDHALSNSSLVAKYLESALKQRQETPHCEYLLGRLYFRIGAIHAVELNDHRTAVTWFQRALPLLERPLPATALADAGRLGEAFVSIGISYWETGHREEAMRLTQHGVGLITQGVKERAIEEDALAVPYSNLAFMHRELGNGKQAEVYATMASKADGSRKR